MYFETAQGSVYEQLAGNKTTRLKRATGETFPSSTLTVFVNPEEAFFLIGVVRLGLISIKGNEIAVVAHNNRVMRTISYQTEPTINLHPIEFWGKLKSPSSVHIGNAIVGMW